jgi:hypothetical protein
LKGIPIGNLTSQIFANIYLHDFDKFVLNILKPIFYCRYGDDFLLFIKSKSEILNVQMRGIYFIKKVLKLSIQIKNNITFKVKWGIRFCGFVIYPKGFILGNRIKNRILDRINYNNISSYVALIKFGLPKRYTLRFYHHMDNLIDF